MSKLKSAVNTLTGGGAKVLVNVERPSRAEPFTVKVNVKVADGELQVSRVYVRLSGLETAVVHNIRQGQETFARDVTETATTFEQDFNIATAQTLQANQEYNWEAQIQLPQNAPPTYQGRNAKHEIRILAGLDTKGNDPDSGWITLMI
jgi:sporulation-control protein spo0M